MIRYVNDLDWLSLPPERRYEFFNKIIGKLSNLERKIIVAHCIDNKSVSEIAQDTKKDPEIIRQIIKTAVKKIKKEEKTCQ